MTDHDDVLKLLDRAERDARRLSGLADCIVEDAQKQSPDVPMDGLPRIERDAVQTISDLAAVLSSTAADRDRWRQLAEDRSAALLAALQRAEQ